MAVHVAIPAGRRSNAICQFAYEHSETPNVQYMVQDNARDNTEGPCLGVGYDCPVEFEWEGNTFMLERKRMGAPVTSRNCETDAAMFEECYLKGGSTEDVVALLKHVEEWQANVGSTEIQIRRWCASNEYWQNQETMMPRKMETVFLDQKLKRDLLEDIDEFTSDDTRAWYHEHCIPFRRGFLLHGPPGTGKTSLVVAIASRLQRIIYRINLVAPRLCDDSLKSAMARMCPGGIVVFEDVDSLFGVHREKNENFNVTFSGLLNAIDGIGDTSKGTLFLFTSNHPEKLDPALRRKGRIDREFYVGPCSEKQAEQMFLAFYPTAPPELAASFAQRLKPYHGITTAQLQEHFVTMRTKRVEDAAVFHPPPAQELSMWT